MACFEGIVGFLWRFLRVLWVCRVATLSAVGGGLLIAKLEQARDLFADTELAWYSWLAFFGFLFLWAWLVHGETPGPTTIAGGVLILGATAGRMILDVKQPMRASITA